MHAIGGRRCSVTPFTFEEVEMAEAKAPNVALDLLRIHSIITRGLNVATEKSQVFAREGFPDAATREGFIRYARSLVSVVHSHHLTENELVFPYLRAKLPNAPYDLLITQHQELVHHLEQIEVAIEEVAADAQAGAALTKLNGVLGRTVGIWRPHIGIEEDHFAPDKVGPLLAPEEHNRLSRLFAEHGRKQMGPGYLVVPFLLYNLPPEERAVFARGMPFIVVRLLVPLVWKKQWAPMRPFLLS
jgi:hemerythrin-like domain-containing protein